jgi:hypothetical protein
MTQEITHAGGRDIAPAEASGIPVEQRMQLLHEALTNPDVQPEKAVAMAELMFRLEDRDAHTRFIAAKVRAIAEMPHIRKDGENTHTKTRYSKWETMQPAITPVLSRHGLVLTFKVAEGNAKVLVAPVLSGHGWEEVGDAVPMPVDTGPGRNAVQAVGSSISYGKRYAAMAALNLVQKGIGEDDDGNAGGGTPSDPYEALAPHERDLVDEGRQMAAEGTAAYEEWYRGLPTEARGFLAFNKAGNGATWHAQNKDLAAKV